MDSRPAASDGLKDRRLIAELAPERADGDVHDVAAAVVSRLPHRIGELVAHHHLALPLPMTDSPHRLSDGKLPFLCVN